MLHAVLSGLLAVLAAFPARAQEPADQSRDREARQLYEAGSEAFAAGRYESAMDYFRRSYELSRRPALLYNIGQSADRLRRDRDALAAFEQYLSEVPDAPNRGDVEARMAILRRQVAEADAAAAREAEERGRREDEERRRAATGSEDEGGLFWTWFALGGAGLCAGLAGVFWLDAGATYEDLESSCGDVGCSEAQIAESGIETTIALTNVMWVASGVALAGAVTLFFVERSSGDGASAEVGIGPGRLELRGRF